MNVCIVASGDFFSDYGGGQVYVRNIVDELARHSDISTTVISISATHEPYCKDYNGIQVHIVNNESVLLETIKTIQPDIVHANGEKLITSRVCKQLNIPCIVTAHHGGIVCPAGTLLNTNDDICHIPADFIHCLKCYLRHTPTGLFWYSLLKQYPQKRFIEIGKRLKRLPFIPFVSPIGETGLIVSQKLKEWQELCNNATHFIAPSNAIADALERNDCPRNKITVIPHGIPIHHTSYIIHHTSTINFYYVGRINYVKGIHILLKAFSSIDNPNIILHLIGGSGNKSEQKYKNKLKRKYSKDKRIIWHGEVPSEQMSDIIKDFHCLVHPAIYLEVFGLNISEALAQNKYVIATRCGGAEMQIHSESDGLLITPNNVQELQNAICKYVENPTQSNSSVISIQRHVSDLIKTYNTIKLK